jgi:hypothetical protein
MFCLRLKLLRSLQTGFRFFKSFIKFRTRFQDVQKFDSDRLSDVIPENSFVLFLLEVRTITFIPSFFGETFSNKSVLRLSLLISSVKAGLHNGDYRSKLPFKYRKIIYTLKKA